MKNEISVSDILHALLSHIVFILASALVCGIIAFGITKAFIKPNYKTSITLYAVSNVNQDANVISSSEQNASAQLAISCAQLLKTDSVMQAVSDELELKGYDISSSRLRSMVTTSTTDTQMFGVTVTGSSPTEAETVANTIFEVAPKKIVELAGSGEVRQIDRAKKPSAPSSPDVASNTSLGVIIGLLLACAVVIIKSLTDTTIWTEEDIAKQFDVPILGTVPQLSVTKKQTAAKE